MQPELENQLGFQPDIYQRYGFLARLIEAVFRTASGPPPVERLRLLDVGAGPVRLAEAFLPDWVEVTRTDVSTFDDPAIIPIAADGSLPFPDRAMDVVLAMDVLEHVPHDDRARVIAECQRVAERCVILAGPVHRLEVVAAERAFAELARTVSGRDVLFLEEHARFGLPDVGEIAGAFDDSVWQVVTVDNAPLAEWQLFNTIDFLYSSDVGEGDTKRAMNAAINRRAPFRRAQDPHYRTFVCGFRHTADAVRMRQFLVAADENDTPLTSLALALETAALLPQLRSDLRGRLEEALSETTARASRIEHDTGIRIETLSADLDAARDLVSALQRAIEDKDVALARESANHHERVQDLEHAQHASDERIDALEHQLRTQQSRYARTIPAILRTKRLEQELADQTALSEQLRREVETLQGTLDTIHRSRSWKLSAPLRSLGDVAGRLRGGDAAGSPGGGDAAIQASAHQRAYAMIAATPLFDAEWYGKRAPESAADPLMHYVEHGARLGWSPHPLFDSAFYLERNPDVAAAGTDPLVHYISIGWREGRNPHPLFDASFYLSQNPDVAAAGVNPLVHYITCGAGEGRDPHPLFDSAFYLAANPDVAAAGIDPLTHYIAHGGREGRPPHPLMDTAFYASQSAEVAAGDTDALTHYVTGGARAGLDPHPLFSTSFYLEKNPDLAAAGMNPLAHYVLHGWKERRNPHPLFDSAFYLEQNPHVAASGLDPLRHFVLQGASEGRDPHPSFDTSFYLEQNPDVAGSGMNPLAHYARSGRLEGRRSAPSPGTEHVETLPEAAIGYVPPANLLPWFSPLRIAVSEALSATPHLNVLVPGLAMQHLSGGPNTAIALACTLAANGVRIRFVSTDAPPDPDRAPFWDHVRMLSGVARLPPHVQLVDGSDRRKPLQLGANDVFMATAWWTAQQAKYATRITSQPKFLYLIQDYEPLLHAASTPQALASETYDLPHLPIVNTSFLHEFLTTRRIGRFADEAFARSALVFEPALDHAIFHPYDTQRADTRRRLLFYARPTHGLRNLFEMGVAALQKAMNDGVFDAEEWEFLGIGESFSPVPLDGGAVLRPAPWLNLEGYARQMRESDLLLSLMLSPHPSYPPLEMAASGGVAVTTTYANKTAEALAHWSPNIIGVEPTIEAIAAGLDAGVRRLPDRERRRKDAHLPLPRTWAESFAPLVPTLLDELALMQGSPAMPVHVRAIAATPASKVFPGFRDWASGPYDIYRRESIRRRQDAYPTTDPNLISFLTPVWNTDPAYLEQLADTVAGQDAGTDFEWIVLDNGSTRADTRDVLARLAQHPAVRLHRVEQNIGIIGGMRFCLEQARHRYVIPLDSDDLLTPDAVRVVCHALKRAGYPPLAYTDEDKLADGCFRDAYWKPDWDVVLFVNSCYIAHLCAIDRRLALELGAYTDQEAQGSHDGDTFVRFCLAGHVPLHIPAIVYSWRMHAESTAGNIHSKPYVFTSQRKVLGRMLAAAPRSDLYELQHSPLFDGTPDWWIRRVHRDPSPITTVLVSADAAEIARVERPSDVPHQVVRLDPSRGLRDLHAIASRCADAGHLIHLLWSETTIEEPEWPWEAMAHFELFPDTVMIGGRIHDGETIRMAGCYFGFGRGCDSPDRGRSIRDPGYFAQMWKQHSVSAVSIQHCVIRPDFLRDALRPLAPTGISLGGLGAWLGAAASEQSRRIVYSPFFCASTTLDPGLDVPDVERMAFRSAYRHLMPDTRLLSASLGLSPATAYHPVSEGMRREELAAAAPASYEDWSAAEATARSVRYVNGDADPTFSLLTTVYVKTDANLFRHTARTLLEQSRPFAEWIILAHGPVAPGVDRVLTELATDARVRVVRNEVNVGILNGLALCLQQASSEFVVPMDADDLLTPDALHVLAAGIRASGPDLIYSDEDVYRDGTIGSPYLRPDFDPVLNAENSYVWHLCAFRRDMALRLGVYTDAGAEFCHDWDTITRFAAGGGSIAHAPHVLYHWRAHSASQSNSGGQNPGSVASTKHVLARTIARLPDPARYELAPFPIFRGAEEWCIRRRPVDPPSVDAVCLGGMASDGVPPMIEQCGFPFRATHNQPESASGRSGLLQHLLREGSEYVLVVSGDCKELDQSGVWEALKLLEMHPDVVIVGGRLVNAADTVIACGAVPNTFGRLVSSIAGLARTDPGPFAMALKPHCILCPADGLFMARATFLVRALERQPAGLDRSELSAWLGACAIADDLRVAYSPLLEARTRAKTAPIRDDGGQAFWRFLESLQGYGFDPRSKVIGLPGFVRAGTFATASDTGLAAAPSAPGERLEPVRG